MLPTVLKLRDKCARYADMNRSYIRKDASFAKTAVRRVADKGTDDTALYQTGGCVKAVAGTPSYFYIHPTIFILIRQTTETKMPTTTHSYIYIDNIQLHAQHGVLPQEQLTGNDYSVSIRIEYDITKAMKTDNVDDTISYADVFDIIKKEMSIPSKLLEHVAGRIADRLTSQFSEISTIVLRITKLNPPMGADCSGAGVEIHVTA